MPLYRYVGDDGRYYHDIGAVEHGQEYELTDDPADGRWLPADSDSASPDAGSIEETYE